MNSNKATQGKQPPGQIGLQPPGSSPMFFVDYKKGEVN